MRLASPKAGRRRRLNLTPLVDVIFLLVIFFLTSSTFLTTGKLRLSEAAPAGAEGAYPPVTAAPAAGRLLLVPVDAATVRVNGEDHPVESLVDLLDRFAEAGAAGAIIAPAASATLQDLTTVIELARRSRLERVSIRLD
jgi:biopolymer transport protein ExbD